MDNAVLHSLWWPSSTLCNCIYIYAIPLVKQRGEVNVTEWMVRFFEVRHCVSLQKTAVFQMWINITFFF